jgi:PAS domain S-box-containing protein
MESITSPVEKLQQEALYIEFFRKNPAKKLLIRAESGQIFDVNDVAVAYYGYDYDTFIGMHMNALNPFETEINSSNPAKWESILGRYRVKHRHADGNFRDVEVHVSPISIEGENFLCYVITDLSEFVSTQDNLRFGEQLFSQFVVNTPIAVAMFDTEMKYLLVSDRWISDYNIDRKDIIGKSHYEIIPNQPQHWIASHQRALKGNTDKFEQDIFIHSNGKLDWIRWEILPWYKMDDKIGGVIIFNEVITQRKKAEEISNRLIEQRSRMAAKVETIEEERKNIARELHDGLGQLLTAAHLNLVLVEQNLNSNTDAVQDNLKRVKDLVATTIQEVRNISQNLRPAVLDDFGIVPAIRNLCGEYSRLGALNVRFSEYEIEKHYSPGIEIAVYRICQESLNNIVKHSNATQASIELYNRHSHILIVIQDNGTGFDIKETSKSKAGSGLLNIQERAELLGGRVQMESQPQNGTEIIIEIPIRKTKDFLSMQDDYE